MSEQQEKIVVGRLIVVSSNIDGQYFLHKENSIQCIGARLSEFQQLAKEILKDEIAELEKDRDDWCNKYYAEFDSIDR